MIPYVTDANPPPPYLPSSPRSVLGGWGWEGGGWRLAWYLEQETSAPSSHLQRASGFLQQVAQTFALACAEVRPLFTSSGGVQLGEEGSGVGRLGAGGASPSDRTPPARGQLSGRPIRLNALSPRADKRGRRRRGENVNRDSSNVSLQVFINL